MSRRPNHVVVTADGKAISRRRAIFTHIIFTSINFLNYTDRYTIAGVLSDIQDYFDIGETAAGLIQTVFILVYMLWAPLFGFLGDRLTRKYILMAGIAAWSCFTLLGSFVPSNLFWLFLVIRGLVGIGESSYITVSPSMIGDLFPQSERMIAISVFSFAGPFGAGFGYILGACATSVAKSAGANSDSAWQWSLRVTPVFGFIAVLMTWIFVPEPARGASESSVDDGTQIVLKSNFKEDLMYLWRNKTCVYCTAAFTAATYVLGCLGFWAPKFLEDAYFANGNEPNNNYIALGFGVVTCISGVLGVALGAYAAKLYMRCKSNSEPLIAAYGLMIAGPMVFFAAIIVEYNPAAIWPFIVIAEITLAMNWPIVPKILIDCVVPHRRALASGVSTMITHLFGDAYSPFFVGLLADLTYDTDTHYDEFKGLQVGVLTCPIVCILGAAAFLACALNYNSDRKKCNELIEQSAKVLRGDYSQPTEHKNDSSVGTVINRT